MDIHTHNLLAPAGEAIINLPLDAVRKPEDFLFREGALYSVGMHPWWTSEVGDVDALWENIKMLAHHPQVVAVGECGFDRLRGDMEVQKLVFPWHVSLSESLGKPMILHCVRAFDILLASKKELRPRQRWTVHGFRGCPSLARQLLDAGFDLSFGKQYNDESFRLTPQDRRHVETDEDY